jgi:hypothetical protein
MRVEKTLFSQNYYAAFIHLGEKTGLKIINHYPDTGKDITLAANEPFEWYWGMEEESAKNQDNILILAVQRTSINVDKINRDFIQRFPASTPFELLVARNYLDSQLPNNYTFTYRSILTTRPCLKN